MQLYAVSFDPPFEISIEFRQKSLKNYDFCRKKKFSTKFWDLREKLSIKSDEFPPTRNLKIFQVSRPPPWREVPCETLL
jgi:hypothetical protein